MRLPTYALGLTAGILTIRVASLWPAVVVALIVAALDVLVPRRAT